MMCNHSSPTVLSTFSNRNLFQASPGFWSRRGTRTLVDLWEMGWHGSCLPSRISSRWF